jgi:tetratricopeptide (TPR) repeat protein
MKYITLIAITILSTLAIQDKSFASGLDTLTLRDKAAGKQLIQIDRTKTTNIQASLNSTQSERIQQIDRVSNNSAEAYISRGSEKSDAGDKQGAIADYTQAIKLAPKNVLAYISRGIEKLDLGDKQGAIADYTQAIKLAPNYAEIYLGRSKAHSSLGNKQAAIDDLTKAAELYRRQGQENLYKQTLGIIEKLNATLPRNPKGAVEPLF